MGTKILQGNLDIQGTITADKVVSRESKEFVRIQRAGSDQPFRHIIVLDKDVQILATFAWSKQTKRQKLSKNDVYGTKYGNTIIRNFTLQKGTYFLDEFVNYIYFKNTAGVSNGTFRFVENRHFLEESIGASAGKIFEHHKGYYADGTSNNGYGFEIINHDTGDFNWEEDPFDIQTAPFLLPFKNFNNYYHKRMLKKVSPALFDYEDAERYAFGKVMIKFVADYSETTTGANKKIWHGNMAKNYIEMIYVVYCDSKETDFDNFLVHYHPACILRPKRFK